MKKNFFECVCLSAIALVIFFILIFLLGCLMELCVYIFDFPALFMLITLSGGYVTLKFNKKLARFCKSEFITLIQKYVHLVKERNLNMKNFIMFILVTVITILFVINAIWIMCSLVVNTDHPLGYVLLACSVALMVFGSIHDSHKKKNYYY